MDIDNAGLTAEIAAPEPGALVNSLRAFGYGLDTAVADLIDNSITAKASRVDIRLEFENDSPVLSLTDNGEGMSESGLVAALRLGSRNPGLERTSDDLGRFGLGLKTASFSQARTLIVATKTRDGVIAARCWDLDFIEKAGEWRLLHGDSYLSTDERSRLEAMDQGTIVLLKNLDRIFPDNATKATKKSVLFAKADHLSDHLGMVFHRFLENPPKLQIWINPDVEGASPVPPWNPFLKHPKTQSFPDEYLQVEGETVHVHAYVLPHQSAFASIDDHRRAGGIKGWNAQQGYYVYRNDRLLVSGSWLNLGIRQEEHYKLARIALDISNNLDHVWSIDVRKSQAVPPESIRKDLKRIATRVRKDARAVYAHRGKIINRTVNTRVTPLWDAKKRNEKITYHLNRKYPLLEMLKDQLDKSGKETLARFLVLVEETIPINKIHFNAVEQPECHAASFEGERDQELLEIARIILKGYQQKYDHDHQQALELLMSVEPFNQHPYLRESLESGN